MLSSKDGWYEDISETTQLSHFLSSFFLPRLFSPRLSCWAQVLFPVMRTAVNKYLGVYWDVFASAEQKTLQQALSVQVSEGFSATLADAKNLLFLLVCVPLLFLNHFKIVKYGRSFQEFSLYTRIFIFLYPPHSFYFFYLLFFQLFLKDLPPPPLISVAIFVNVTTNSSLSFSIFVHYVEIPFILWITSCHFSFPVFVHKVCCGFKYIFSLFSHHFLPSIECEYRICCIVSFERVKWIRIEQWG